jgi:small subunit ribosomal protein S6
MKNYELLLILPGTLTEEETKPFIAKVEQTLTENKATNLALEQMGKNRLAYPIKHIRYGYIYLLRFEAENEHVQEIKARLRLIDGLLRSLVQIYDPVKQKEAKINFINLQLQEQENKARGVRQKQELIKKEEKESTVNVEKISPRDVKEGSGNGENNSEVIKPKKITGEVEEQEERNVSDNSSLKDDKISEQTPEKEKGKTVSFEEIDKKLDELLDSDIASV